jgi:electron transport complex protein RnfG
MKILYILATLTCAFVLTAQAKVLVSPIDAMHENFGADATVTKKNILLNKADVKKVQTSAKTKLDTKIYRIYIAKKDDKPVGYGVLVNKKVRSKNTVVLYLIKNAVLQDIQIIAFNEPQEYLPSKTWTEQFQNRKTDKMLKLSREIPTITGATLSAKAVTDGSRIAFAIYNTLLKG